MISTSQQVRYKGNSFLGMGDIEVISEIPPCSVERSVRRSDFSPDAEESSVPPLCRPGFRLEGLDKRERKQNYGLTYGPCYVQIPSLQRERT